MQKLNRRRIGQILLDGGFVSHHNLERALGEQRQTNELLGQVLVRMGVLDQTDLKAALSVQEYLDHPDDAVNTAAGVRKMLGALLIQAGHISNEQLEHALHEQKKSGEKLGEVLVRLGLMTSRQLDAVLYFQQKQTEARPSPGPLRLGEILISKGYISHEQLDDALYKQTLSQKKLGEVLIEEGYAHPHHIKHGIHLQHMLLAAALAALLTACGSVGDSTGTQIDVVNTIDSAEYTEQINTNSFEVTSDDYTLLPPNFYYSTNNAAFWSIQAAIAKDLYDPDFRYVIRIDVLKEYGVMPSINKTFSIEDNAAYEKFPGKIFVFNGQESTNKKVEAGTISFTPDSTATGNVAGSFEVVLSDYDSTTTPAPQYHLKGNFSFKMDSYGPVNSSPVIASNPM
ncbi:MAG: hypothetical protein AAB275_04660 [Deltaproteobacteria bacterium]